MTRILSVLPDAGGNAAPTLLVLAELARRGAEVRVLGHEQLRDRVGAADVGFTPFTRARRWSPVVADPGLRSMLGYLRLASDRGLGADVRSVAAGSAPDLVLVDCMLPGALRAARGTGAAVALFVHTLSRYWVDQWTPAAPMGAWLRLTGTFPGSARTAPHLAVLTSEPELDPRPGDLLGVPTVQTGAAVERAEPARGGGPVLVSLSTISYPGQLDLLRRLVAAVARTGVPAVVTTGPAIDPREISAPPHVQVRRFVPHAEVLPTARLVVGHGGHGTTMRALAHGVPVLVVPLSSVADHHLVGAAVARAGVGASVAKGASEAELARVVEDLLADDRYRRAARNLAGLLAARDPIGAAADALEGLVRAHRAR
jgi:UDP:flavonoid glycosyltransferase YjiC (YdhE family)